MTAIYCEDVGDLTRSELKKYYKRFGLGSTKGVGTERLKRCLKEYLEEDYVACKKHDVFVYIEDDSDTRMCCCECFYCILKGKELGENWYDYDMTQQIPTARRIGEMDGEDGYKMFRVKLKKSDGFRFFLYKAYCKGYNSV